MENYIDTKYQTGIYSVRHIREEDLELERQQEAGWRSPSKTAGENNRVSLAAGSSQIALQEASGRTHNSAAVTTVMS